MDSITATDSLAEREQLDEEIKQIHLTLKSDDAESHLLPDEGNDSEEEFYSLVDEEERLRIVDAANYETIDQPVIYEGEKTLKVEEDYHKLLNDLQLVGDKLKNFEACLFLNKVYQAVLEENLKKIQAALAKNRENQEMLKNDMSKHAKKQADFKLRRKNKRKFSLPYFRDASFSIPYFKDADGKIPPLNEDAKTLKPWQDKIHNVTSEKQWTKEDKQKLIEAVKLDGLEKLTRPFMNRMELQMDKLMNTTIKEERDKIEKKRELLKDEIKEIQNFSDEQILFKVDPEKTDWMKMSVITFSNQRSSLACQLMWQNVLSPHVNRGQWLQEEVNKLLELVEKSDKKNWVAIAKELNTNRTPFQCLQYYRRKLDTLNLRREWDEEEEKMLREVVESCRIGSRIPWNQVSFYMEDRNADQCSSKWAKLDPLRKRGKWTKQEDSMLITAVHLVGTGNWNRVSYFVPHRNGNQCRERWVNSLDPSVKLTPWNYEEDGQLLNLVKKYGPGNWSKISSEIPGRTDNMILQRYKRLMEWKQKEDWLEKQTDEVKLYLLDKAVSETLDVSQEGSISGQKQQQDRAATASSSCTSKMTKSSYVEELEVAKQKLVEDLAKQQADKKAGNVVVPRPSLLKNNSPGHFVKLWQEREKLHNLIEKKIAQCFKDGVDSGKTTFDPKKQYSIIKPKLNELNPGLSVAKLLEIAKSCVTGNKSSTGASKRLQRKHQLLGKKSKRTHNQKTASIDKKLRQLLQVTPLTKKMHKGRPRRFFPEAKKNVVNYKKLWENRQNKSMAILDLLIKTLKVNLKQRGTDSCPCLTSEQLTQSKLSYADVKADVVEWDLEVLVAEIEKLITSGQELEFLPLDLGSVETEQPNKDMEKGISLPLLPPSVSSLNAFKLLLLERYKLNVRAGRNYRNFYQWSRHKVNSAKRTLPGQQEDSCVRKKCQKLDKSEPSQHLVSIMQKADKEAKKNKLVSIKDLLHPVQVSREAENPDVLHTVEGGDDDTVASGSIQSPTYQQSSLILKTHNAAVENDSEGAKRGNSEMVQDRQNSKVCSGKIEMKELRKALGHDLNTSSTTSAGDEHLVECQNSSSVPLAENMNVLPLSKTWHVDSAKPADGMIMKNIANIKKTAEFQLLQARFQSIFVWPAVLSTITPTEKQTGSSSKIDKTVKTADKNSCNKSSTQCRPRRNRYPCARSKYFYRHAQQSKEKKRAIQERRLKTLALRGKISAAYAPTVENPSDLAETVGAYKSNNEGQAWQLGKKDSQKDDVRWALKIECCRKTTSEESKLQKSRSQETQTCEERDNPRALDQQELSHHLLPCQGDVPSTANMMSSSDHERTTLQLDLASQVKPIENVNTVEGMNSQRLNDTQNKDDVKNTGGRVKRRGRPFGSKSNMKWKNNSSPVRSNRIAKKQQKKSLEEEDYYLEWLAEKNARSSLKEKPQQPEKQIVSPEEEDYDWEKLGERVLKKRRLYYP